MSKYIDTRDLNERLEELDALETAVNEAREALDDLGADASKEEREEAESALDAALLDFGDDEEKEIAALRDLENEIGCEWRHGVTLIPESEFADYCKELIQDIGDLPKDLPEYIVIDWDATADNLRVDYSAVELDGDTYLFRE
jgi:hypothetical protein